METSSLSVYSDGKARVWKQLCTCITRSSIAHAGTNGKHASRLRQKDTTFETSFCEQLAGRRRKVCVVLPSCLSVWTRIVRSRRESCGPTRSESSDPPTHNLYLGGNLNVRPCSVEGVCSSRVKGMPMRLSRHTVGIGGFVNCLIAIDGTLLSSCLHVIILGYQ